MQVLFVLTLVGMVWADVSQLGYKYEPSKPISLQTKPVTEPSAEYIPPSVSKPKSSLPAPSAPEYVPPADVKEITPVVNPAPEPSTDYIPPNELKVNSPPASSVHVPQSQPETSKIKNPTQDGYSYGLPKAVKNLAPVSENLSPEVNAEPAHELANDGYRYKTVRRIRYRYRA